MYVCRCESGRYFNTTENRCKAWSSCDDYKVEAVPPSHTNDRQCEYCGVGTYYSAGACVPVTPDECPPGEEETQEPTVSTNRMCTPCVVGETFYNNATSKCQQLSPECDPDEAEEQTRAPGLFVDRNCTKCEVPKTFFNDTLQTCDPVTTCAPGYEEVGKPQLFFDRVCRQCVVGETYYSETSKQCEDVTPCPVGATETANATLFENVQCGSNTITCDGSDVIGITGTTTGDSCSCAHIHDECVRCSSNDAIPDSYGVVLTLLDAMPSDYTPVLDPDTTQPVTMAISSDAGEDIRACADMCRGNLSTSGCIGFVIESATGQPSCSFMTSYIDTSVPDVGARMYTLPMCEQCSDNYELDGTTCIGLFTAVVLVVVVKVGQGSCLSEPCMAVCICLWLCFANSLPDTHHTHTHTRMGSSCSCCGASTDHQHGGQREGSTEHQRGNRHCGRRRHHRRSSA